MKVGALWRGVCWVGGEKALTVAVRFVAGVVLARLLTPADYGVIGMMAVFIAVGDALVDGGMANAVINRATAAGPRGAGGYYRAGFRYNFRMALAAEAAMVALAWPLARFCGVGELLFALPAMGLSVVIGSLAMMQVARLTVEMRFAEQSLANFLGTLGGGTVAIALALAGCGLWSLVAGALAAAAARTLAIWWMCAWRLVPATAADGDGREREQLRDLWRFGWRLTASYLLSAVHAKVHMMVIGWLYGKEPTGLMARGASFSALPADMVVTAGLKVAYPLLMRRRADARRLCRGYFAAMAVAVAALWPALALLAYAAKPIVAFVVGEAWLGCVPYLRILCLAAAFEPLIHLMANVFYVSGRTDRVLKLDLVTKTVALAILAVTLPRSLEAVAWGMAAAQAITTVFYAVGFGRELEFCARSAGGRGSEKSGGGR